MFLTTPPPGKRAGGVVVWLNLRLTARRWTSFTNAGWLAGARIVEGLEDEARGTCMEFKAGVDLDGNVLRVFYDFTWETRR